MKHESKPLLYIPDYENYGDPFQNLFTIKHNPNSKYSVDDMLACDFLMLTGGADIHPSYYGQDKCNRFASGYHDEERDKKEWALINAALEADTPIIGICRGAQWLSVAAGGTLIQHVDGHTGGMPHVLKIQDKCEELGERPIYMSTDHHQMVNLTNVEHILHAWTDHLSSVYLGEKDKRLFEKGLKFEPEIFYIPVIRGFGVQGHPEYMTQYAPGNMYLRYLLKKTFIGL